MFTKIELKIKKLFKKKDTKKEPYQRLIEKIQKKTEKLSGKKDKDSLEALSIITATDELYGLGYDHYLKADIDIEKLKPTDIQETAKAFLNNPQIYIFKK